MSDDIEPPEGWERRGQWLFRQYGKCFATVTLDEDGDFAACVINEWGNAEPDWSRTEGEAVAWANAELGVPKPVEVVEREFADGSVLVWSKDGARSARVELFTGDWQYGISGGWAFNGTTYKFKPTAIQAAKAYVRGDA